MEAMDRGFREFFSPVLGTRFWPVAVALSLGLGIGEYVWTNARDRRVKGPVSWSMISLSYCAVMIASLGGPIGSRYLSIWMHSTNTALFVVNALFISWILARVNIGILVRWKIGRDKEFSMQNRAFRSVVWLGTLTLIPSIVAVLSWDWLHIESRFIRLLTLLAGAIVAALIHRQWNIAAFRRRQVADLTRSNPTSGRKADLRGRPARQGKYRGPRRGKR